MRLSGVAWLLALVLLPLVFFGLVCAGGSLRPALAQGPDTIQQIVVEGLQRSTPDSVRAYMLVQEGDTFDPARIDRSLKSLFATGRFANVSVRREGDILIVTVVENPTVNRVAFEGNRKLDDETLQPEISLKPLGIYTRATVQSDVRRILALYRRSGRFAATVEPKIIELPQNRVDVIFEINEGPITGVEKIRFIGNKEFADFDPSRGNPHEAVALVALPQQRRHLRSGPPLPRSGTAAPLLPEGRLRRFPGRVGGCRTHAQPGKLHRHLQRRRGRPLQGRFGRNRKQAARARCRDAL